VDLLNKSILVHRRSLRISEPEPFQRHTDESIVERIVVQPSNRLSARSSIFCTASPTGSSRAFGLMGLETLRLTYQIRDAAVQPQRCAGHGVPA
jgi:hypothetical protein